MKQTIAVQGITCQHCVKTIESTLLEIAEVQEVKVELATGKVEIHYNGENKLQLWQDAIEQAGYQVVHET